jgi:hypothetical protein
MKFSVISDLHLEFADLELPGGEVLILSGDVCEAKHVKAEYDVLNIMNEGGPANGNFKRSDRYTRFFHEECSKYDRVIYVMGNHEHYGGRFDKTRDYLASVLPKNIELLEKSYTEIADVVVVGATLWTDLNKGDPITAWTLKSSMNDYRVIQNFYKDKNLYYKLTPEETKADHMAARQYICDIAKQFADRPVVVVTHHSPSRLSTKPRYQNDYHMNGGYSSSLEHLIESNPNIQYWTHGHTHDTFEYLVHQCTVICNPRGYVGYEERPKFFDPTVGFML